MKKIGIILAVVFMAAISGTVHAQSHGATVDSTLVGRSIFSYIRMDGSNGAEASVTQSREITEAVNAHISRNPSRKLNGYRIRIFFDNKQSSRTQSEAVLSQFRTAYPDIPAYSSYANPYFKVTVGDFRTRSEALAVLNRIRYDFPLAFLVKETINFPAVRKNE
ncbi:MAG: SPOR domain-containing protein [Bacteroidales bacterium]|nr:SPOR domain-containing protein [Bacteroidales bacterium]